MQQPAKQVSGSASAISFGFFSPFSEQASQQLSDAAAAAAAVVE